MLEFRDILPHVRDLAGETARRALVRSSQLEIAQKQIAMDEATCAHHAQRLDISRQSWLKARPIDPHLPWDSAMPAPPPISHYTAIACDGSQIPLDRHEIAPFYLLNIGKVALHYGTGERPCLTASANLFYREEDLLMAASDNGGPQGMVYITEKELATRRFLAEIDSLGELVEQCKDRTDPVAFVDGTLILWAQEAEKTGERRSEMLNRFLAVMERAKAAGVPVAGYLSRPASREVIGALRVSLCPDNCLLAKECVCAAENKGVPPCSALDRLTDADLFSRILSPGQRSALFLSDSRVLKSYNPEDQKIAFFYLHADAEIARVELPRWVADNSALLDRCHTVALDQARKGSGYPICLSEAHEQAIVRGPERDAFFKLLERAFIQAEIPALRTAKAVAKRRRSI